MVIWVCCHSSFSFLQSPSFVSCHNWASFKLKCGLCIVWLHFSSSTTAYSFATLWSETLYFGLIWSYNLADICSPVLVLYCNANRNFWYFSVNWDFLTVTRPLWSAFPSVRQTVFEDISNLSVCWRLWRTSRFPRKYYCLRFCSFFPCRPSTLMNFWEKCVIVYTTSPFFSHFAFWQDVHPA